MTDSPAPIATGPIVQIAWVVDDLDPLESLLRDQFGSTAWMRIPGVHFGPESCEFRGAPADFTADISLAYAGDLQLELIRPVSGDSIYTEFLDQHGPGLHHHCYEVDDIAAAMQRAEAAGFSVLQHGSMMGMMEFAYVDGAAAGAPYIELARIGPEIKAMYDGIRNGG